MKKADLPGMPPFFDRYINQVDDIDLLDALTQTATFDKLIDAETLEALGDLRYAPGKWSVKDILQHIIDTERIMSYRALRIGRNDPTPLPGFDENTYAENTGANQRSIADLYDEYAAVRQSSILLFRSLDATMMLRVGTASDKPISPLALGYVLVGHAKHHVTIIQERYVPLLS
jgi:hypothetical protein